MKPFLKVCGMRKPENIMALINEVHPDFMGMIFYEESKRYAGNLDSGFVHNLAVKKVGVFVNADTEYIFKKIRDYDLDAIQLHGDEPVEQLSDFPDEIQLWKVFRVGDQLDLDLMHQYAPYSDYFLLDTRTEAYGGSGKRFNWDILASYDLPTPFILSGGIDESALEDLPQLKELPLAGIDVNSKFELEPGVKDIYRLTAFRRSFKSLN